ncbi:MAG: MGMT family protein [Candidatus Nanopelagicales bacterium]
MVSDFTEALLDVVSAIPAGQIRTYGEVAADAGRPGAARAVGAILSKYGSGVPWWRVVRADGTAPPALAVEARERLAADGLCGLRAVTSGATCNDRAVRRGRVAESDPDHQEVAQIGHVQ